MTPVLADYLTEAEAAAELKRKVRTLQGWRKRRIGPAYTQIAGKGTVFYRRSALIDWLIAQEVQPVRSRRQAKRVVEHSTVA
jgi:hypothetical protein